MKAHLLNRKIHYWGSIIIALPVLIIIITGLILLLKKELAWVQPPTQKGSVTHTLPQKNIHELLDIASEQTPFKQITWQDFKKVEYRPNKGIAKLIAKNNWELQIDTANGEVLSLKKRRSDWIEALHDGSWFANWTKYGIFLPATVILLVLWLTGVYLALLPYLVKKRKRRKNQSK